MKGVDLFCGCGGMSLGFQNAGVVIAEAYDNWPKAVSCYNLNFSHPAKVADISDVKGMANRIAALKPDIIIGGPPCQDFSQAGKRQEGERAGLTGAFAAIVESVRPEWFVMENVPRAQQSAAFLAARAVLTAAGYGLTEEILNAYDFGVPQRRKRVFCIGRLGADDGFLADDLQMHKGDKPIFANILKALGMKWGSSIITAIREIACAARRTDRLTPVIYL